MEFKGDIDTYYVSAVGYFTYYSGQTDFSNDLIIFQDLYDFSSFSDYIYLTII